jgi:putative FmdB family regulatory protein
MPLYEYQCDACGHRFEKIQKFSDPNEDTCPTCGGTVQKLISSPAIQFKGSGFYITDYPKTSSSDASGRKSSDKASSEKGDSAKSDSSSSSDSSASKTDSTSSSSSTKE